IGIEGAWRNDENTESTGTGYVIFQAPENPICCVMNLLDCRVNRFNVPTMPLQVGTICGQMAG
ncbi:hypothetical protein, partial [Azonexus sp.]|uniref:hypothetical protein n=1 Tax=Azonexus sp. TaxID=1872668 RepID=UPI0035ADB470